MQSIESNTGTIEDATAEFVISVNKKPVKVVGARQTGESIKRTAREAGVEIEQEFVVLVEEGSGRTRVVGDLDVISIKSDTRIRVIDNEDNS